jgi:hypothetical protein
MKHFHFLILSLALATTAPAQNPPYDKPPEVEPPYYRVRYEAKETSDLIFPVQYTVWIPEGVKRLRGIVVHQHGCGEGSCKSGQTGAWDLHWQALAEKHDCALFAASYEQPQDADCQMWCDPRNGSAKAFQKSLADLGKASGHPELAEVPWALWGHSGGGHWVGGMTLLYPEKTIAVWHRSGVPLVEKNPGRPSIKTYTISDAAIDVPMMCNPGTEEGVTVKEGRFAGVWPANETFFREVRGKGGLIGIAVDPLTGHACGNQRYMAIPWLDACMSARLPEESGGALKAMPTEGAWLAAILEKKASPADQFDGDPKSAVWLPNAEIASKWMHYVEDTAIPDKTPPPAPIGLSVEGNKLTWNAKADFETGIAHFIVFRNGEEIATVPEKAKNPHGRPVFQGLQYSDTPAAPLVKMEFVDEEAESGKTYEYRVVTENTVGLRSQ